VNVISLKTLRNFAAVHAEVAEELLRWHRVASRSTWRDLNDVRCTFPDADQYRRLLILNVRHNHYRLIAKVDYEAKLLMVKALLTHDKYSRGGWKKWAP
jgi:mRNA interferase HigB